MYDERDRTQEEIVESIAQQMGCKVDTNFSEEIGPYETYSDWAQAFFIEHILKDDKIRRISVEIEDGVIKKMRILYIFYPHILYYMKSKQELNELGSTARIPDEIEELKELRHLDICAIGVGFSKGIWRLPKLETLNIFCPNWERITNWPGNMTNLRELSLVNVFDKYSLYGLWDLERLDFGNSVVGEVPNNYFRENKKLQVLNFAGSTLKDLPSSLFRLRELRYLNLECTSIEAISPKIKDLKELRVLLLRGTKMIALPGELTECENLEEISFPSKLRRLPIRLGNLSKLTKLDLYQTEVRHLPESIGMLQNLNWLTVPKTLETLPESIGSLSEIQILDLQHTKIASLPESLGSMSSLRKIRFPKELKYLPQTIGNLSGLTVLDLRETEIEEIPESIGWMTQLAHIFFPKTLCMLPESIGGLQGIQRLNLSETKLKSLPKGIGRLKGLCRLDFPVCLETLPDTIGGLESLEVLDLENTRLQSLPESIGRLEQLRKLTLPNSLAYLPDSIRGLCRITMLDLEKTSLSALPEGLCEMKALENIQFPTGLKELPANIGQLSQVKCLDLRMTAVTALPESIGKMSSIKELYVAPTLKQIPEGISGLKKIRELNLSNTQIERLPDNISEMSGLKILNLAHTKIRMLPNVLKGWVYLKELNLSNSPLLSLPEEIGTLENLEALHLDNTKIKELPSAIGNLKRLKILTLNSTEVESLPEEICSLKFLKRLSLSKSRVKQLPSAIGELSSLDELDISMTSIDFIPDSVEKFCSTTFYKLNMAGLKLDYVSRGLARLILSTSSYEFFRSPAAFLTEGQILNQESTLFECSRETIESFYKDELIRLNECKVIFLGDGNVGKSSLIDRILGERFQINRSVTNGISIKNWKAVIDEKEVRVRFWDFGGQEIMHTMHLCFLTARTVYVIVLDSRQDHYLEKISIDWLQTVKTFAPTSPIILVLNKCDVNPRVMLNLASLKESFPLLIDCVRTSALDGTNIDHLKKLIAYSIKNHSSYSVVFNKKWFGLKEQLETMDAFYISNKEYISICHRHGIASTKLQESLLRWFSDLGVSYHYSDFDFEAEPDAINVLNPEWVTNGIYRLILRTRTENGRVFHEEIYKVLGESYEDDISPELIYSRREATFILEVMRQKGLSLDLGQEELIPMKLSNTLPPAVEAMNKKSKDILHFAIKGDYFPNSIIHKLIIQRIREVNFDLIWRNGALLYNKNMDAGALVELRYDSRYRLDIYIVSNEKSVEKEYLNIIRDNLLDIIAEFNLKNYEEVICYRLEDGTSGEEPYLRVWKPYIHGIQKIYLPNVNQCVSPGRLLNEIYTKEQINERGRQEQTVSHVTNNYLTINDSNINDSNISVGNNNQLSVPDFTYKRKMKQVRQTEFISEEAFERLIFLLEKMIEQQELPVKKHLELVEILHSNQNAESMWTRIRDFLTDAANIATITTVFPMIANEIAKIF